jgi:hypothetical protein
MKYGYLMAALLIMSSEVAAETVPQNIWRLEYDTPMAGYNYTVFTPKVDFTITCHPDNPVVLTAHIDYTEYGTYGRGRVGLIVDGTTYSDITHLGTDFPAFWEALRHAKTLEMVTFDNERAPLPIEGLMTALPAANANDYYCHAKDKPEAPKPAPTKGIWQTTGDANSGYRYSVQATTGYKTFTITCAPNAPVAMSVSIGRADYGTSPNQSDFGLIADSRRFGATAALRDKFTVLWEALRNAKRLEVYTPDGNRAEFPTEGLASTLPAIGTANFPCRTEHEQQQAMLEADLANIEPLQQGDIHVSKYLNDGYGSISWNKYLLKITSRTKKLVVTDVSINRGQCTLRGLSQQKMPLDPVPPLRMAFGDAVSMLLSPATCNPQEVTITTLGGELTFSFDN